MLAYFYKGDSGSHFCVHPKALFFKTTPMVFQDSFRLAQHNPFPILHLRGNNSARQSWFPEGTDYETARAFFEASLPRDLALLNEAHALLVRLGASGCRPKRPRCGECPLGR